MWVTVLDETSDKNRYLTGQNPTVQNLPGHNNTGHNPRKWRGTKSPTIKFNYIVIRELHFIIIICYIQVEPIDKNCNLYFNGLQLQQKLTGANLRVIICN